MAISRRTYYKYRNKEDPDYHEYLLIKGIFDESKGKFNGYGTFANPNCHIHLGVENGFEDPVMLGMRFFNSHNGDSKFGGEIFGIRAVCQNYMAWGETLGHVKMMHFKSEENVADELAKILEKYRDRECFVIGGEQIYRLLLPQCDTVYVTKINYAYEADTYFPDLDRDPQWVLADESEEQTYFELTYTFRTYRRI